MGDIAGPVLQTPPPGEVTPTFAVVPIRRLTRVELRNAVRLIAGVSVDVSAVPFDGAVAGFDNNVATQTVTEAHVTAYQRVAEEAASAVFGDPARRAAFVGCSPDPACLETFSTRLARLVYRRPARPDELDILRAVARATVEPAEPFAQYQALLETVLQQPQFLFRPEVGEVGPPELPEGWVAVTGPELATRLAFAVTQAPPPPWLLDAAEAGQLGTVDGLRAAAGRLLGEAGASPSAAAFLSQWLGLAKLDGKSYSVAGFTPELLASARQEVEALFVEAASAGSLLDVYSADHTFVDARLAALYGLPAPSGGGIDRVALLGERSGVLSSAAVAMLTSKRDHTSIVHRGLFVRDGLLCDSPPPPPPGVETNVMGEGGAVLSAHLADPGCASCHRNIDPIGYGLEGLDVLGRTRSQYGNGEALPEKGWVTGIADSDFTGARQLASLLRSSPMAGRCLAQKHFQWTEGRTPTPDDRHTLDALTAGLVAGSESYRALVMNLVAADAFRFRRKTE